MLLIFLLAVMMFDSVRNSNRTKCLALIFILGLAFLLYYVYGINKPQTKVHASSSWWQPVKKWTAYSYKKFRDKVGVYITLELCLGLALLLYYFVYEINKPQTKVNLSSSWWQPVKKWTAYSYKKFRDKVGACHC